MDLKRYCGFVLSVIIAASTVKGFASDRNYVVSEINDKYYSENLSDEIGRIKGLDTALTDDVYLKQVFSYLDEYSEYYTREEYENQVVYENSGMISATIARDEMVVKIDRFGDGVEDIFAEYMKKCEEGKVRKLVLDLTECPGGYISVMHKVVNHIMPKGIVLTARFRNDEKIYYSELEKCPFEEITVKVSSQTASAAEILAAGLQEAGVATVVGVNTSGKTSIQSFHRLESGGAFKLTCGEYLTRNGNDISETGVIPDIVDYTYAVKIRWNENCEKTLWDNKPVSD